MSVQHFEYIPHIPVLLTECLDFLVQQTDGVYIDGTLGGGGHSEAILNRLEPTGLLYGIDQDPEAHQAAGERIGEDDRFHPLHGNFGHMVSLLPPESHGNIDGILFDLGVSTHQIRERERGFSFQEDGPLDMRMGNLTSLTAANVVNEYSEQQIREILWQYGEERLGRPIARAIVAARPLSTTGELAQIVRSVVKGPHQVKSLARVFQALRIEVNREMEMLKKALEQALDLLKPNGILVAISYHSLEDRLVKNFFKSGNFDGEIPKDFYGHSQAPLEPLHRKVIKPGKEEMNRNPAARSARLRAASKRNPEDIPCG
ncbi:MAG: 16S rRNA (cytosine(1402)-N(4))-methyltransferase RsmH [Balneolaceae bacterium]